MNQHKPLPADVDAERALLGSLLLDRDAIIPVAAQLDGATNPFSQERHNLIYQAMLACYDRREPPDLKTVTSELRRRDQLDRVGGAAYLISLSNEVPTATHAEYYATNVEMPAVRRNLIKAAATIGQLAYDETLELEDVLAQSEEVLQGVTTSRAQDGFTSFDELSSKYYDLKLNPDTARHVAGISSGFAEIDKLTGGLHKSDLIILAARPAVGKTSLALNIAQYVAEQDYKVAVFSLEMSKDQLHERMLASMTSIDLQKLRQNQVYDNQLQAIHDTLGKLSSMPIFVNDTAGQTITSIRTQARRLMATHGIDLIIVDYLQLLEGGGKDDQNRVQAISKITRGLKIMAREIDVPVIALSQLSRAVESRTSHVPMLSDLRDSGSVEQDADQVWFIYREEMYDPDTDKKGIAELHIAKHRNGPTGVVPMRFFKSTTRFTNLETYRQLEGY